MAKHTYSIWHSRLLLLPQLLQRAFFSSARYPSFAHKHGKRLVQAIHLHGVPCLQGVPDLQGMSA
jgi:hypothetical protein